MYIKNCRLKHLRRLDEDTISYYVQALSFVKPIQTKRNIRNMTLGDVDFIKSKINSKEDIDLIKIVALCQGVSARKILNMRIIMFFRLIASVRSQIKKIVLAEENLSPNHVNVKWEMVKGQERMSKFGIYNILENLSNGDPLKYKSIMKMEYSEVFTILLMKKTNKDLQYEMSKIKIKTEE